MSNLDFKEFRNHLMFKTGCVAYNQKTGEFYTKDTACYDALIVDESHLDLLEVRKYPITVESVMPALARLIDAKNPRGFQQEIVKQWREVTSIVKSTGVQPTNSLFVVMPPGTKLIKHKHEPIAKQILVFGYKYDDEKIENAEQPTRMYIGENGERTWYFPDDHKIILTMKGNPSHEPFTNEWRFFWTFDFPEYVTLDESVFSEFTKTELDENKF